MLMKNQGGNIMALSENIRNICLMGHGGEGKTSLAESMLYLTKGTDRLGKVPDGTTVCDYDPEEIKRQISISATPVPVEFGGYKLNVMDTPGYFDFVGEVIQCLEVADCGLVVLSAKSGIDVGTEKAVKMLNERGLPKMFYVSKIDEEHADFFKTYDALREMFGVSVCAVTMPVVEGDKITGIVDIIKRKAYKMNGNAVSEIPVPASAEDKLEELRAQLSETVAETSEELMDKFFAEEPFTDEEFANGIRAGVKDGALCPVFCGSAISGLGTEALLSGISAYAPSPVDMNAKAASGAPALFVFKTISDQYGKFSFFKVISGSINNDLTLENARSGGKEKLGHIYTVKGKKNTEIKDVPFGDIAAVSKLAETKTGDTLREAGSGIEHTGITFPEPCYSLAVSPIAKGGEEKIASGLTRLAEEDPTFSVEQNAETHQLILSAMGDIHIDVLRSKLKSKFGADTVVSAPMVPYREKIKKKVKVQGRHKKQSGGHGQYGDVWIEFEPAAEDSEQLVFEEKIFGGSVPKNFHPAVEKGLRDCISTGVLAGYPVVGLKATLVDGSYHDVDSSEMAFKLAAALAYKAGLPQANPVLMEPIGALKVYVPDSYMGDIIGDLNKRRGRIMGMNPADNQQIIEAEVPMAEMATYAIDLRSMTQGRGSFTFKFDRYEEAPMNVQQKVIEEAKLRAAEEG